jgi:phenylpropionate dioxygenase-like ring-hydroxylating dioxygenase large terminal subunit
MSQRTRQAVLREGRVAGARRELPNATTLPPEAFTSEAVYQAEVERIFARSWLCAGRADQIPEVGDYFTLDLLGDKLVVVRGTDGEIRVLSRVCRHRAAELVRGSGNARSFQCPYHSWTYKLDGALSGAPFMEGVEGFDRKACSLPEIRSELWEGWIFVNFDREANALADQLAPLSKLLENYCMSEMIAVETATFDSPFNWKVLVDNFMEAYHHIGTHNDTLETIFPGRFSHAPDNDGPYSVLMMPVKPEPSEEEVASLGGMPRVGELDPEEENRLVAAVVYPFHLFAPSAESLSWYQILPETYDRFTLRIFSCFPRKTLDDPAHADAVRGLQEFVKVVHGQDIGACEAVWSGLNSRSFEAGRLSLLEKPIWQFNQWWLECMAEAHGAS